MKQEDKFTKEDWAWFMFTVILFTLEVFLLIKWFGCKIT